ncbi:MAG: alpha/beta fold hydrolase BchO [Pseudomonadota bacterium]
MFWSALRRPDWNKEGRNWPYRDNSTFVRDGFFDWHVQTVGEGPSVLLLHGTAASTHSWAPLAPLLADHFRLVMIDLPGHGFTRPLKPAEISLRAVGANLASLLKRLEIAPEIAIGHSSGAAILIQMILDNGLRPNFMISLNGALRPFSGAAGVLFPLMAKSLYYNPLAALFFAESARDPQRIKRLLSGTGSKPPQETVDRYAQLLRAPGHINGALAMMAHWRLAAIERRLGEVSVPVLYAAGADDKAVPPVDAVRLASETKTAISKVLPGLGHLAHEEAPARVAALIEEFASG